MDFTFSEEQQAVAEAASGVFTGMVDPERVARIAATSDGIDRELWAALAAADLLGLGIPVGLGGGGLGLIELCLLLEAQGSCVAPVPLWPTLVLGALPMARYAPSEVAARWLPGVAKGEVILTGGLAGTTESTLGLPPVTAVADGGSWRLSGTEPVVPFAHVATRVVLPARVGDSVVVVLVDPSGPGVRLERVVTTNGEIHPHLHLDGALTEETVSGPDDGLAVLHAWCDAAWTGLAALAVGVSAAALQQTAAYLNEREQFGRSLSTFQGTMLRAGDAAIDLEAMRVTLWQAAWRIDTGRDATESVAIATWQASERGQRVVHATQHLHGGIGADVTYPIHRYFLWGKQIEQLLGGPSRHLARLGDLVAARVSSHILELAG